MLILLRVMKLEVACGSVRREMKIRAWERKRG